MGRRYWFGASTLLTAAVTFLASLGLAGAVWALGWVR